MIRQTESRPVEILLVEDNPGDVRLTREALKEGKVRNNLHVAQDGVEALAFLRREGRYGEAVRPDLILLDLNLPRRDGREVLEEIKADPQLRAIPVVILTSSQAEQDIVRAYDLHANCYVTKPVDLDQFITVVKSIEDFWFAIVKLPPPEGRDVPDRLVRILLVEDNPGDARLIREVLREAVSIRCELMHEQRLSGARERCAEGGVDVVLLDLSLPDAHGLRTVTECLEFAPTLPIIVLTGLDDETVAVQAVQAGAQDYLVKGQVESTLLVRAIRYAMERKRLDLERQQLLASEREARGVAEAAARARDEVLRVVSHDLGNSLSAVKIHAVVLGRVLEQRSVEPEPEVTVRIAAIRDLVAQMNRLRQDLLDIASIEAGHLSVERRPQDARALVEDAASTLVDRMEEKRIRLDIQIADGVPPVLADRDRILQVLGNLLGNATKFTPEDGRILVRVEAAERWVSFSVEDSGVGIAAEHLPHIFDRYWKMRSGNPGGTGLGLAIARGIVEAHGGEIAAVSVGGEGTTLRFTLPEVDTSV